MGLISVLTIAGGRDYSLAGPEVRCAVERGLTTGHWYKTPVPRKRLKELMQRSDWPALRDTMIWLGLLAGSAVGGIHYWGSWTAVPFFLVYGIMYGAAADSRLHECSHRTAFRTSWLNDAVYYLACFMMMRGPTPNRWSHTRHHTYTGVVGFDPEISAKRPPQLIILALDFFGLVAIPRQIATFARHSFGRLTAEERAYVPAAEIPRMIWEDRMTLLVYIGMAVACVAERSILPAMLIGLPRGYGRPLLMLLGLTQHLALDEDVLDYRLNSRTVYMNRVFRFIYWEMNYHVEHHMYPLVPYYALAALHEEVRHDCPPANTSVLDAWCEILPAVLRQVRDYNYFVVKKLPPGAGVATLAVPRPTVAT